MQIAYFEEFKGQKTLLFAGSKADVVALQTFFCSWSGAAEDLIEHLGKTIPINTVGLRKLVLHRTDENSRAEHYLNEIVWHISPEWQQRILGLLDGLCNSKGSSHQFLDSGGEVIQIICSKDEYPHRLQVNP